MENKTNAGSNDGTDSRVLPRPDALHRILSIKVHFTIPDEASPIMCLRFPKRRCHSHATFASTSCPAASSSEKAKRSISMALHMCLPVQWRDLVIGPMMRPSLTQITNHDGMGSVHEALSSGKTRPFTLKRFSLKSFTIVDPMIPVSPWAIMPHP